MASTRPSERLLKYPPMERQDLNQSQLGSFKFTPVDSIPSFPMLTTNYLQQQLAESFARAIATTPSLPPIEAPSFAKSGAGTKGPQQVSATDTNFFNKHIKPDLGDSRLRLGPAALRSAVESAATSPVNKDSFWVEQQGFDSWKDTQCPNPSQGDTFFSQFSFRFQGPNMDPTAASFIPGDDSSNLTLPDPTTVNQSLCLALVNEQQAHNATRLALSQEVQRCLELEAQSKKNMQQISSLTATVNNLGAIIKHNVNQSCADRVAKEQSSNSAQHAEENALKEFYGNNPRLTKTDGTILHDALRRQRENYESQGYAIQKESVLGAANCAVNDDAQLFNLDLLKSPNLDASSASALRRTLRKHFSITDDIKDDKSTPATPVKPTKANKLINISPESAEIAGNNMQSTESEARPKSEKPLANGQNEHPSDIKVESKPRLLTTGNPVLEVPSAVVAKYARRSASGEGEVLKDRSNNLRSEINLPNVATLRVQEKDGMLAEDTYSNGKPNNAIFQNGDRENKATSPVEASSASVRISKPVKRLTIQIPNSFDGEPKWTLNKDNPIFENQAELWHAMSGALPAWIKSSPFPEHPVRYLPEDAAGTPNAYRTVMIDHIPVGSTMKEVLAVVRGGTLQSLQLFPPIGRITSFMTARVVFNYEAAANAMYQRQAKIPFKVKGAPVRAWKPMDPTYPINGEIEEAVYGEQAATRILLIGDVDDGIYALLPAKLARLNLARSVIEYGWTWDDFASIEFTDIRSALKAFSELQKDRDFMNTTFRFDDDYTNDEYEPRQESVK